ncbi:hypothetical protein [uncultured Selenomonas sp.]|uniref:hypothetical protein n=1 Tax=uncultured Selenomonas sp. TaxID=159275 RepID=UPI0028E53682|nr:hypothetical protein [uncultured Selenomonas sp.]
MRILPNKGVSHLCYSCFAAGDSGGREKCIRENARIAQNQEEYQKHYEGLVARYDAAKARFDKVTEAISAKEAQSEQLAGFIKRLKAQTEPVAEFDSQLWASMVECVTVGKGMTVVFRDGTGVRV